MDISYIKPGSLHVITGGMKARKTLKFISALDQLSYAGKIIQVFKPKCDVRKELHQKFKLSEDHIVSRTGMNVEAGNVNDKKPENILYHLDHYTQVVGIEEVTLFKKPDTLVDVVLSMMQQNIVVVVSGLDKTFRGEPFDPMPALMAYATTIEKSYGICDIKGCDRLGEYPQRIIDGKPAKYNSPTILVGASDTYEIRCLNHHKVRKRPKRNQ